VGIKAAITARRNIWNGRTLAWRKTKRKKEWRGEGRDEKRLANIVQYNNTYWLVDSILNRVKEVMRMRREGG
jgi:hypothetical protein